MSFFSMIFLLSFIFILFLLGSFLLKSADETLAHAELASINKDALFYLPFHQKLFDKSSLRSLTFVLSVAASLCLLGAALFASLFLLYLPLSPYLIILAGLLFFFFLLLFHEILPLICEKRHIERLYPFVSLYLFLFTPITYPLFKLKEGLTSKTREQDIIEEMREDLLSILRSTPLKKRLHPNDIHLLESALKFKDLIVKEVMVPRVHLFCLEASTSIREAARLLSQEGYSRTPVYKDSLDNIYGLLLYKDIFAVYRECEEKKKDSSFLDQPIETIMKGVFYTPETTKVAHLLQEFRLKQKHMAIVVDEYGGTEGVVTIEDILEEIVGEIADEYDVSEEIRFIQDPRGEGWIVDAHLNIKEADEAFSIDIPKEGDYDTIGGFIFFKAGTIPPKGEIIAADGFLLEVLSISDRSVEKVRLTLKKSEAS